MPNQSSRKWPNISRWLGAPARHLFGTAPQRHLFGTAPQRRGFGAGMLMLVVGFGLSSCAGGPTPGSMAIETGSNALVTPVKASNEIKTAQGTDIGLSDGNADELDCGRLSGRMKVRILQIRGYDRGSQTSGLSRSLQGVATEIFGGTSHGLNPNSQYDVDVAQLRRQNESLAARGCKTFDLDAELKGKSFRDTPRAQ